MLKPDKKQEVWQSEFFGKRAPIRKIPSEHIDIIRLQTLEDGHAWAECGPANGPVILFAHGLMGNLYNCADFFAYFAQKGYRMIMPFLPMYDLPLSQTSVTALGHYLNQFVNDLKLEQVLVTANSTGGSASISWGSTQPPKLRGLVLIGSSGVSGKPLQQITIRRNDWQFMYENMQSITINKESVLPEMIDDVFEATRDREVAIRVVRLAKSVVTEHMHQEATKVTCPTLICWGDSDIVTPPEDALEIHRLIPHSELVWFTSCGHLPQMEQPEQFCAVLDNFLSKLNY